MTGEPAEDPYELRTTSNVRRGLREILPKAVPGGAAYEFITGPLLQKPYRVGKRLLPPIAKIRAAAPIRFPVARRAASQARAPVSQHLKGPLKIRERTFRSPTRPRSLPR